MLFIFAPFSHASGAPLYTQQQQCINNQREGKQERNIVLCMHLFCCALVYRAHTHIFDVYAIIQPMSLSKYLNDFILHEFGIFHRIVAAYSPLSPLFFFFFFCAIHSHSFWLLFIFPFMAPNVLYIIPHNAAQTHTHSHTWHTYT